MSYVPWLPAEMRKLRSCLSIGVPRTQIARLVGIVRSRIPASASASAEWNEWKLDLPSPMRCIQVRKPKPVKPQVKPKPKLRKPRKSSTLPKPGVVEEP